MWEIKIRQRSVVLGAALAIALSACTAATPRLHQGPSTHHGNSDGFVEGELSVFPGVPYTGVVLQTAANCYVVAAPPQFLAEHKDLLSAHARVWGEISSLQHGPDTIIGVLVRERWVVPSLCAQGELVLYAERVELL